MVTESGTTKESTAGATAQPQPKSGERTLAEGLLYYLSILLKYKWLVVGMTVIAGVGVVVFSIVSLRLPPEESPLPNYYEAYATLLVSDSGGSSTQSILAALGMETGGSGGTNYAEIAQRVVQTRSFLDTLVEEHDIVERYDITTEVRSRSREVVLNNSRVSYDPQASILTVAYEHIDPEFAQTMANSIVDNLQEWFRSRGGLDRMQELQSLEARLVEVEEEIARLEGEIQAFQREHGVLDVGEMAETQAAMLSDLQAQLVDLAVQIRNQETLSRIEDDPALARLRAQQQNVIGLIREIENGYTGGARTMPSRERLPELALEFRRLQTDLTIQQRIYQAISEQYEVARLTAESEPVFSVLERAEVPDRKAGPSRAELSMTVTLGAFAASIALAYMIHFLRSVWAQPENRAMLRESFGMKRRRVDE
ncbi:MAG: GumC family protein [Spirochaetaceae bacterium]